MKKKRLEPTPRVFTLRDVRRLAPGVRWYRKPEARLEQLCWAAGVKPYERGDRLSGLDRLISRFGPHARVDEVLAALKKEPFKTGSQKRAEAVAAMIAAATKKEEATGNDLSKASESPAPAVAEKDGDNKSLRPSEQGAAGPAPKGTTSGVVVSSAESGQPECPTGNGGGELAREASPESHTTAGAGRADSTTGPGNSASSDVPPLEGEAREDMEAGSVLGFSEHDGGLESIMPGPPETDIVSGVSEIRVPSHSFGGDTGPDWAAVRWAAVKNRRAAKKVEDALRLLVQKIDAAGIEESPRIDGRRLIHELVTRRMQLSRAVRRESERALIVLACDVSGSCSAVCAETLSAAVALAARMPSVLLVRHSNGLVIDVVGSALSRSRAQKRLRRVHGYPGLFAVVQELQLPVAAVIAWGDMDAGNEYQALVEESRGALLLLLDHYAARHGPRPASTNLKAGASHWKHQPAGWWQGVHDAATTVVALNALAKTCKSKV